VEIPAQRLAAFACPLVCQQRLIYRR